MCKKRFTLVAKTYDRKGRLIAVGTNNYKKSHPLQAYFAEKAGFPDKQYLHSEVQSLLRSGDKQVDRITVERYHANGSPALASPCPICREAIKAYGVRVIEYTSSEGWVKEKIDV